MILNSLAPTIQLQWNLYFSQGWTPVLAIVSYLFVSLIWLKTLQSSSVKRRKIATESEQAFSSLHFSTNNRNDKMYQGKGYVKNLFE